MDSLTDLERQILAMEAQWWATCAGKDEAIRAAGLTPVRYYQILAQLIRSEAALAHDPVTVNRLRRIAASRASSR
jgi:hypothetical protein